MKNKTFSYREIRETAVHVAPDEAERLERAALHLADLHQGRSLHDSRLLRDIEVAALTLPKDVRWALIDFRDYSNSDGTLMIRGLPLGPVPPTPTNRSELDWTALATPSIVQLMVMSMLGRSIAYSDEKSGQLVQDVHPKPGCEARQENSGSVLLELHTEDGFHPRPPHFLSLLCLRGDHDKVAATVTCGIVNVLHALDNATVAQLRKPEYRTKFSTSFVGNGSSEQWTDPRPILSGDEKKPDLHVDFNATEALTPAGRAAYEELAEAMLANLAGCVLAPGELVVIDNRQAVHGRTFFRPRYDGADRWLRRSFAVSDLRAFHGHLKDGRRDHAPVV